jgi:hypothetical protein
VLVRPARELTGPQLAGRLEMLSARSRQVNDEMIAAGRGLDRPSDIRVRADPLSVRWQECADAYREASDERARRISYHGTLRPIGRQA